MLTSLDLSLFLLTAWTNVEQVYEVAPVGHKSMEEVLMVILRVWRIEIGEEECPQA